MFFPFSPFIILFCRSLEKILPRSRDNILFPLLTFCDSVLTKGWKTDFLYTRIRTRTSLQKLYELKCGIPVVNFETEQLLHPRR